MTNQPPADPSTPPAADTPTADGELPEQQLEGVSGAGEGRRVTDCEGYAYLGSNVLGGAKAATIKQPE